jgi:hypothetical protein
MVHDYPNACHHALGPPINKLEGDSHATHLEASGT